jgi:cell division protein FtsW
VTTLAGSDRAARRLRVVDDAQTRVALLERPLTSYHLVIGSAALLLSVGLVMVLSSSSVSSFQSSGSPYTLFERQATWVVLGLPVLFAVSRMAPATLRRFGYPLLLVSAAGLVLVLVPGVGSSANGATLWIAAGPVTVQPSEIAKLGLALWGADLLVRKRRLLHQWRHLLIPLLPVGGLLAAMVMAEPDMGTTVVVVFVLMALLWVVGAPGRLFLGVGAGVAALGAFIAVVSPYRLARITSFAHPFASAQGSGYQAVQGLYALASGGWWGVGLGNSRAKWDYLPNAHTDFVFAIIGEELGLVGTLVVLTLFGILGYAGIRIAQRSRDPFARLVAGAITAWLVGQALVNVGAVVGLLPITGIPLPFISFGGSALLPSLVAVGVLGACARHEPGAQQALAVRRRARSRRRELVLAWRPWS